MSTTQKAQITFPSDTEMVVTRRFEAPRDLVWRAYPRPSTSASGSAASRWR